jgi:hypothetical protein
MLLPEDLPSSVTRLAPKINSLWPGGSAARPLPSKNSRDHEILSFLLSGVVEDRAISLKASGNAATNARKGAAHLICSFLRSVGVR